MTIKSAFKGIQWVNLITLLGQVANDATGTFPAIANNHWLLMLQAIIGVVLPSVGGYAHQVAFGTPQDPAKK